MRQDSPVPVERIHVFDCPKCGAPNRRRATICWHCKEAITDPFQKYFLHSVINSRLADLLLCVASLTGIVAFVASLLHQFTYANLPPQLIYTLFTIMSLGCFIAFYRTLDS